MRLVIGDVQVQGPNYLLVRAPGLPCVAVLTMALGRTGCQTGNASSLSGSVASVVASRRENADPEAPGGRVVRSGRKGGTTR